MITSSSFYLVPLCSLHIILQTLQLSLNTLKTLCCFSTLGLSIWWSFPEIIFASCVSCCLLSSFVPCRGLTISFTYVYPLCLVFFLLLFPSSPVFLLPPPLSFSLSSPHHQQFPWWHMSQFLIYSFSFLLCLSKWLVVFVVILLLMAIVVVVKLWN